MTVSAQIIRQLQTKLLSSTEEGDIIVFGDFSHPNQIPSFVDHWKVQMGRFGRQELIPVTKICGQWRISVLRPTQVYSNLTVSVTLVDHLP